MARYIDADELTKEIKLQITCGGKNAFPDTAKESILRIINEQPTADVAEVKYGKWEFNAEDIIWGNSLKRRYCTNCGAKPFFNKEKFEFLLSDYCPNCGAKMDK